MKKQMLAILLALIMMFSTVSFAEGLVENVNLSSKWPVVNEKISVDITVVPQGGSTAENPDDFWIVKYWEENTNLDINWTIINTSVAEERIQLMLSTGDMPDAILGYSFSYSQVSQYGADEGMFYPIDELLDYCPNFSALLESRPDYRAAISTSDGKMYGFPMLMDGGYSSPLRFFINVDWLENLGLEQPKTLDEFYDVLCAFRDQDANGNGDATDEIPFSGSWSEGYPERAWIMAAYGLGISYDNVGLDYSGDEATVTYAPRAESYKEYLTYMKKLWDEGLLDPDIFTQNDTQYSARVLESRVGFGGMAAPFVYYPDDPDAYEASYPFAKEEGGKQIYLKANPIGTPARAVINADCDLETAAALANFFDSMFDRDEYILSRWGLEKGSELATDEYGYWYDAENDTLVYDLPDGLASEWNWKIDKVTFWAFPGYVGDGNDAFDLSYAQDNPESALGQYLKDGIRRESWVYPVIENCYTYAVDSLPDFYMTEEDLERLSELTTPLDDYVANMEVKYITGVEDINNIDEFWSMLDELGVQELIDIYAKYYEQYKANM